MNDQMKNKKVILTLLTIMLMGTNSFVYADERNGQPRQQTEISQSSTTEQNIAEIYNRAGLNSPEVIINTLANLGISNEELQKYVGQGKKIFDIIEEREITMIDFKKALTQEYKCQIKRATKNDLITRKEAKMLTSLLKEKMANWGI